MCNNNCNCLKENESSPMIITDSAGREIWWLDAGRPEE